MAKRPRGAHLREDAPTPQMLLPELRSWEVHWHNGKSMIKEVATGHAIDFPHPNMIAIMEYELLADREHAHAMVRRIFVSTMMTFNECTTPTLNGVSEVM